MLDDSDSDSGRLGAGWSLSLVLEPPVTQPPQLTQQPVGQTNLVGRTVVFSAAATGTPPLFYRWRCNAAGLAEGGRYSGTDTPALFIANAQTNDTGGYTLVVSNAWGTVSSVVANLTVVSPVQPFIMPDSLGLFDNGQFQFVLSGAAGSTYMIEVSSDLRAWKALRTLRLTNSDSVFLDATTNLLRRFYRARLVP